MIYIAEASHNESGGFYNGKKGDQLQTSAIDLNSKSEVHIRPYYNYTSNGWNYVLRPVKEVADKGADNMIKIANNSNVGYTMSSDRNSLWVEYQRVGDFAKVGLCNCDCSSSNTSAFAAAGVNIPMVPNAPNTSMIKTLYLQTGMFALAYTNKKGPEGLQRGDVLLCPGMHVATVLGTDYDLHEKKKEEVEEMTEFLQTYYENSAVHYYIAGHKKLVKTPRELEAIRGRYKRTHHGESIPEIKNHTDGTEAWYKEYDNVLKRPDAF